MPPSAHAHKAHTIALGNLRSLKSISWREFNHQSLQVKCYITNQIVFVNAFFLFRFAFSLFFGSIACHPHQPFHSFTRSLACLYTLIFTILYLSAYTNFFLHFFPAHLLSCLLYFKFLRGFSFLIYKKKLQSDWNVIFSSLDWCVSYRISSYIWTCAHTHTKRRKKNYAISGCLEEKRNGNAQ